MMSCGQNINPNEFSAWVGAIGWAVQTLLACPRRLHPIAAWQVVGAAYSDGFAPTELLKN
jgi:hypothetical protein